MSIATLQDIIVKARKLSGSGTSQKLTNAQVIDYINSFYLYDLPAFARILKLKDNYTFTTQRGIDTYAFDSEGWQTIQQPVFCAKRPIILFMDRTSFFTANYNWQYQQNLTQGDGTVGPYTGTITSTPIIRSVNNIPTAPSFPASRSMNLLISANVALGNTQAVTDDGNGSLIDPVTGVNRGTINYDTGAISVTFGTAIPSGNTIVVEYNSIPLSIPLAILFWQNQFVLRPVPDKAYTIEMTGYRTPAQALLGTTDPTTPNLAGTPELLEWWELLSFGVAKKIFEDRLDYDGVAMMEKSLQDRYMVIESRSYSELGKQRTATIYSDQLNQSYNSFGWGFGGSNF